MAKEFGDARLYELEFLAKLNRDSIILPASNLEPGSEREMAASLIHAGYLNDLNIPWRHIDHGHKITPLGLTPLEMELRSNNMCALSECLAGQQVLLQIRHRGRNLLKCSHLHTLHQILHMLD
jgi:hypothetical protein